MKIALLAAVLFTVPALASPEPGISLTATAGKRQASLLNASLDASYRPSESPALRLIDDVRLARTEVGPLDEGGGVSSDVRAVLALILGFIPGFGLGHLIARDRDGFILFLIIDIVLYAAWWFVGGWWGTPLWGPFRYIGGLIWLVVHIFQAIDAYGAASGDRLIERTREKALRIAGVPGREEPVITTRQFAVAF